VRALVEAGLSHTVADIFTLTDADLRGVPRFGAAAAARLAEAIDAARRVDLDRLLVALGIPSVGAATARGLAQHFKTLAALRRASAARISAAPGIGPAAARDIAAFFRNSRSQDVIDALLRHGVRVSPHHAASAGPLAGSTIVFTGKLDAMTRAAATRAVERRGGRTADQVTRATDLLVAGSAPGSKVTQARHLGISIISEREFLRRCKSEEPEVHHERERHPHGTPEGTARRARAGVDQRVPGGRRPRFPRPPRPQR
jgi:DNA ligase (NAD+)